MEIRKIKRLNEEISRWAFEIQVSNIPYWDIIFTNPTAGPWKKIEAKDENGNIGEVYRFPLEDERPDIVMINDKLKSIIIIEAKDDINKLLVEQQIKKTVEVTEVLADMFKTNNSSYWKRNDYKIYLGLLWGSSEESRQTDVDKLFDEYDKQLNKTNKIDKKIIVGIETLYNEQKNFIKCIPYYKYDEISDEIKSLMVSLTLV